MNSVAIEDQNLAQRFSKVASRFSESTAIRLENGNSVSYRWLDKTSNQICRLLSQNAISQGQLVIIFHDKSPFAFALQIACIKSGIIYCNLDPKTPSERLTKIIEQCQPAAMFTCKESELSYPPLRLPNLINLTEDIRQLVASLSDTPLDYSKIISDDGAYIVFTSGSTGTPKGALMSQSNVLNFVDWTREEFEIDNYSNLTNINPMYFDNSVFDFYASLFNGACMSPVKTDIVSNPLQLVKYIESLNCSHWFSVPTLLVYLLTTKAVDDNSFPSLKKIIFGGEGFPKKHLNTLFKMLNPRVQFYNVYGPTECTCICSSHQVSTKDLAESGELVTLGRPNRNFEFNLLGEEENIGELELKGPCVGLGYYRDPKRTSESFNSQDQSSQFDPELNSQIYHSYRTGDLLKKVEDRYYFLGRVDNQIKHLGYRIELEDIDFNLSSIPEVKECACFYHVNEIYGGSIICAVALEDKSKLQKVKESAKNILPSYMKPKDYLLYENLPKNANGKIDRNKIKREFSDL